MMKPTRGLTLPELLVALAVVAILIAVAAPSFRGLIEVQRLRSVNSQLVTDLQFARNEAAARGVPLRVMFGGVGLNASCYVLYTSPTNALFCDCLSGAGSACNGVVDTSEVRTVAVPTDLGVTLRLVDGVSGFAFDPATGALLTIPTDQASVPMPRFRVASRLDASRQLHTVLNQSGRPTVCSPAATNLGEAACVP